MIQSPQATISPTKPILPQPPTPLSRTTYLGHTLADTSKEINRRYKLKTVDFPDLRKYLFWLEDNSPDKYFEDGLRSYALKTAAGPNVRINRDCNAACRMTALALKLARNNYERHEKVEDFFLINDLSTVAVEVPVWYWDKTMGGISGHIDILQIRGGKIHILDYKPDAHKGKNYVAQLSSYAQALSYRTKTSLYDICCAYFDENAYHEFSPKSMSQADP